MTINNTLNDLFQKLPKINTNNTILLLTHTDMDGSGPVILLKSIFNNIDVEHCPNALMSRTIKQKATDDEIAKQYDTIIVCDISCTEQDAEIIQKYRKIKNLILLDHHMTAVELNKYKWACVQPDILTDTYRNQLLYGLPTTPVKSSGTSLLFDYLTYCGLTKSISNLELAKELTFFIAGYDTWDWVEIFKKDMRFQNLDTLFETYGFTEFENTYIERLSNTNPQNTLFNNTDELLLRIAESKRQAHITKIKRILSTGNVKFNDNYLTFVFCFATEYLQDTFDIMKENYPDTDLYIIDYGNGLSFRTTKEDINIADIVKPLGGGGHPGAGGIAIPFRNRKELIDEILQTQLFFDE